jgi:hypothetical protein
MFEERINIVKEKLKRYEIPKQVALNSYTLILNTDQFIKSHLGYLETYEKNEIVTLIFLERMEEFLKVVGNEEISEVGDKLLKD